MEWSSSPARSERLSSSYQAIIIGSSYNLLLIVQICGYIKILINNNLYSKILLIYTKQLRKLSNSSKAVEGGIYLANTNSFCDTHNKNYVLKKLLNSWLKDYS